MPAFTPDELWEYVNVTTIMFLMSGDLTGLCLYITKNTIGNGNVW